jgi:hypothetical protein
MNGYPRFSLIPYIAILLLLAAVPAAAAYEELSAEFWTELEPFLTDETGPNLSREEAVRRTLEEARFVFSGMIYGFRFRYTPSDRVRQVDEIFELEPIAEIPWGDPNLFVKSSHVEENRLYVRVVYRLREFQEAWKSSWRSNTLIGAEAYGEASIYDGYRARFEAIRAGVKTAIREHFRQVVYNKPKAISGDVVLDRQPELGLRSAMYAARVGIRFRTRTILPYSVF